MKHKVRTAYGDSEDTYGGEDDDDPHGASQGNAAGPAIWALVSSPLLDILRERGYGARFISPLKKEFFNMCGFAFVDDTDTIQTVPHRTTTEELVKLTQEELDLWETLIRSTGGAIVGEKSDYTVINWVWRNGKPYYEPIKSETVMTVRNEHGEKETLEHLPTHTARRTLGVWQAADGNERKQTEVMKEKIRTWASSIVKSSLSKADVHMGVKTALYPSAMFGLMATALTKEQSKEVFLPLRKMILPKMKICRTTPGALVHGPKEYGGLEIKDVYTLQGIAHVKALLDEASQQSATGKLLRILKEYHTLEIGLEGTIYNLPYDKIKDCMTESWMKNTLEFLWENEIEIKSDDPTITAGWSTHDTNIMQDAIDAGYSGKALAAINRCRMYMKALYRSDISDISGQRVTQDGFNVSNTSTEECNSGAEYTWQHQERPPTGDRTMWRKFLKTAYCIDRSNREWEQPCGQWNNEAATHATWTYSDNDDLYELTGPSQWKIWHRSGRRGRNRSTGRFRRTEETTGTRRGAISLCSVISIDNNEGEVDVTEIYKLAEGEIDKQAEAMPDTPKTLQEAVENIHPSLKWVVEDLDLPMDNGQALAAAIRANKGKCMSDGSLKDMFGTSGFTSMLSDDSLNYVGANRIPGEDNEQTSYRSELVGILANIIMHNAICQVHGIDGHHEIQLGCDNESALWTTLGGEEVSAGDASSDILHAIHHQVKLSPLQWIPKWVKGHQDEGNKSLDIWALANVACDTYANRKWISTVKAGGELRPNVGVLIGENETVWIQGRKISSSIDTAIYDKAHRDRHGDI